MRGLLLFLVAIMLSAGCRAESQLPRFAYILDKQYGYRIGNAWVADDLQLTNKRQVTTSNKVEHVRWLDARTLAVVSYYDIWLVDVAGQQLPKQLTFYGDVCRLCCSSDQQYIFFNRLYPGSVGDEGCPIRKLYRIHREKPGQAEEWKLKRDAEHFLAPAGPDSVYIITRTEDWSPELRILNWQTKQAKLVFALPNPPGLENTDATNFVSALASSRDGQQIAICFFLLQTGQFCFKMLTRDNDRTFLAEKDWQHWALDLAVIPSQNLVLAEMLSVESAWPKIVQFNLSQPGNHIESTLIIVNARSPDYWH